MMDSMAQQPNTGQADDSTRRHLRGSTLLLAGRLLAVGISFAIQVIIVRYLSRGDFGAFAYALSIVSLGTSIVLLGMDKSITRFVPLYQEEGDYGRMGGAIVLMVGTALVLGLLLVAGLFGLQSIVAGTVNDPLSLALLLLLSTLAPVQALDSLLLGLFAVFASPRSIFFRKHLMAPGLQLAVVLALILLRADVRFLAVGYAVAGGLGVLLYAAMLLRLLARQGVLRQIREAGLKLPVREVFSFTLPLTASNLAFALRSSAVVILLEHFRGTAEVAGFRAVLPVARMDLIVLQSFTFLFTPLATRMLARKQWEGINHLYWQSAVWIAVISFPIFALSFSMARPLTTALFGARYADSSAVMALLSLGFFFNAALGFNALTLRVYGKVRYLVTHELIAAALCLLASLLLIPVYGAWGAAIATAGTLIYQNIAYQVGLRHTTGIRVFDWRYSGVYLSIVSAACLLFSVEWALKPPIAVEIVLTAIVSVGVLLFNRRHMEMEENFPEIMRFPLARRLFGKRTSTDPVAGPMVDIARSAVTSNGFAVARGAATDLEASLTERLQRIALDSGLIVNGPEDEEAEEAAHVMLVGRKDRPRSVLYRFQVGQGPARRFLLVKVPRTGEAEPLESAASGIASLDRPRLVPLTSLARKAEWEHAALAAIQGHVSRLDDPRFGAVRVLDVIPEIGATVMEDVASPSLRTLCRRNWWRVPFLGPGRLDLAFRHAGAWLRAFHALPPPDHAGERHTRRDDFSRAVTDCAAYLSRERGQTRFFNDVAARTVALAGQALPNELPMGLSHGDYAPRNILVGPDARVTVLDTLARWQAPIYEDIAFFLISLAKAAHPVPRARRSRFTKRSERLFLEAYFGGDPVPHRAIRLYEVLMLLDKWCSLVSAARLSERVGRGLRAVALRVRNAFLERHFRNSISALLKEAAFDPSHRVVDEKNLTTTGTP